MSHSPNIYPCTHEPLPPAVQRCCDARSDAMADWAEREVDRLQQIEFNKNMSRAELAVILNKYDGSDVGARAYVANMPSLSSRQDALDFIACIAHGMTIGAVNFSDSSKMLYAAQVALSGYGKEKPAAKPQAA